jgi:hypothetical protein
MTNILNYPITSPYGAKRTYTVNGVTYNDVHDGIDFGIPQGTPLTLPPGGGFDGKVTYAGLDQYGGAYVDVKANSDGGVARFLHLSRIDVFVGQQVTSNQQIGLSGGLKDTWGAGLSTGSHLHFGLLVNNRAVDPLPWLKQAYSVTPEPQPNPEVKEVYPDNGDGLWNLCKKAGYPVIPTNQPNHEPTNSICYNRITELNGTNRVIYGQAYKVDFDPVKWFNSKTAKPVQVDSIVVKDPAIKYTVDFSIPVQPQPEAITTPAQPIMPTISIEEPVEPSQPNLKDTLTIDELRKEVALLRAEKVQLMKANQLASDLDLNEVKKESFSFLQAFKGAEKVGGVTATIILALGYALANISQLNGVISPQLIAQSTSVLSVLVLVAKSIYSTFKK